MIAKKVDAYVERTDRLPLALEGLGAVAVGILLLVSPQNASQLLMVLFGLFWLLFGIRWLVSLFRDHKEWGWRLAGGIGSILLGLVLLINVVFSTYITAAVIVWIIAASGCVIGLVMILQGIAYRYWGRAILGFILLGAGFLLAIGAPVASFLVPWLLGAALILAGGYALLAAFRKRAAKA